MEKEFFDLHLVSKYRSELMGIAILMVVFHHLTIRIDTGIIAKTYMFLRVTGAMGVDIFLFLSAIGLYRSYENSSRVGEFYKKRFVRIIPVYVIICGIDYAVQYLLKANYQFSSFLYHFFLIQYWKEGLGDWYIAAIIILYAIYPAIYCIIKKNKCGGYIGLNILWAIVVIAIYHQAPNLFHNAETFWPRIPVFLFGVAISRFVFEYKGIRKSIVPVCIGVNVVSLFGEAFFALQGAEVAYSFWPRLLYFPLAVSFVVIVSVCFEYFENFKTKRIVSSLLSWVGAITLEVYLLNQRLINKCCILFETLFGYQNMKTIIIGNLLGVLLTFVFGYLLHIMIVNIAKKTS